jgi:membrane protease YdiL (CAAX protease family)
MASDYYRVPDWETRLQTLSHGVGLVVAGVVLSLVAATIGITLFQGLGLTFETTADLAPLPYATLNAIQFLGYYAASLLYLRWRDYPDLFRVALPSLRDLALVVAGFVALYALAYALTVVFSALGIESATNSVVDQGREDPVRFLYLIPVTFLFVAPAEEILFRGVIQGMFRRAYGVVPAVVFASAIFGLGHWLALLGSDTGKVRYVVVAAMLGLVLGALYELTENILVPILVHAVWNSASFVSNYVDATGAIWVVDLLP